MWFWVNSVVIINRVDVPNPKAAHKTVHSPLVKPRIDGPGDGARRNELKAFANDPVAPVTPKEETGLWSNSYLVIAHFDHQ